MEIQNKLIRFEPETQKIANSGIVSLSPGAIFNLDILIKIHKMGVGKKWVPSDVVTEEMTQCANKYRAQAIAMLGQNIQEMGMEYDHVPEVVEFSADLVKLLMYNGPDEKPVWSKVLEVFANSQYGRDVNNFWAIELIQFLEISNPKFEDVPTTYATELEALEETV